MKKNWKYTDSIFEADKYNEIMLRFAPWSGHRNFGYDLISFFEPEVIVELGSHYGCSAFTFAQSIKDNSLKTKLFAVDLWEAIDIYTKHDYEQNIYSFFKKVKEEKFFGIDMEMLKMTFDEASHKFEESSIDILHIDGSHEYMDVKHDFETWLPKVNKNGIILFHDVSDQKILGNVMGSCIYWKEIQENYTYTIELPYSWGLGVLFLDKSVYEDFINKVDLDYYLKLNTYEETLCKDRIRKDYFIIEDKNKWISCLEEDKTILEEDNKRLIKEIEKIKYDYEEELKNKMNWITSLEKDKMILEEDNKRLIKEIEKIKYDYEEELKNKINWIISLEKDKIVLEEDSKRLIKEIEKIKDDYEEELKNKINWITSLEKDKIILEEDSKRLIKEIEKTKDDYEEELKNKINWITSLEKDKMILEEDNKRVIQEIEKVKFDYEILLKGKETYIESLKNDIKLWKKECINIKEAYDKTIQLKDQYISELENKIQM